MLQINTAEEGENYIPDADDWVWKWNSCQNPDTEAPKYKAYDKPTSMMIEEAF